MRKREREERRKTKASGVDLSAPVSVLSVLFEKESKGQSARKKCEKIIQCAEGRRAEHKERGERKLREQREEKGGKKREIAEVQKNAGKYVNSE